VAAAGVWPAGIGVDTACADFPAAFIRATFFVEVGRGEGDFLAVSLVAAGVVRRSALGVAFVERRTF
jgi:hypothetical protein